MKYKKKPVEIEAMQWDGTIEGGNEIIDWSDGSVKWYPATHRLVIYTLEGQMNVASRDWVIRGVKGEYYPCKPDIFDATYERTD